MKRLTQVLSGAAPALVLGTTPAFAQGAEFSLGGGVSLPLGDFGDASSTGWHGLAAVSFAPSAFPLGFQLDGMYQRFGVDDVGGSISTSRLSSSRARPTRSTSSRPRKTRSSAPT